MPARERALNSIERNDLCTSSANVSPVRPYQNKKRTAYVRIRVDFPVATLQEPDSGDIHLGAIDVVRQKDEVRETLGYLPQDFGLYRNVSAEKLLDHLAVLKGLTARQSRRDAVEALLRQTNLWEIRRHKLGGFSS